MTAMMCLSATSPGKPSGKVRFGSGADGPGRFAAGQKRTFDNDDRQRLINSAFHVMAGAPAPVHRPPVAMRADSCLGFSKPVTDQINITQPYNS